MSVPNKAEHPNRKANYDAARGVGTYSPVTSGDAARFKQNIPGVGQHNTLGNYEKRANTKIPGFAPSSNPFKSMRNTPGSGQY
jgi:hypothetical protein